MSEPEEIQALRKALSYSPDNLPLHEHLVQSLCRHGRYESALESAKEALEVDPNSEGIKIIMAEAYFQLDKPSEALVILEALELVEGLTAKAMELYARVLSNTTELVKAAAMYKSALAIDASLKNEYLDESLAPFLLEEPDESLKLKVLADDLPEDNGPGDIAEKPSISFSDIGGMDDLKEDIRMKIVHPLKNAELFKAYGKTIGGGILLYGPPGCGKTYMARATAGEVSANFFNVGLHDVLNMYIGQSERNLHEIFNQARRHNPSVLFIDEVDALGASRSDMKGSASRHTINQLLSELDGSQSNNDGLLVLGATNAPWHLDNALRRPGRFDRIIFVPPPDEAARAAIFRVMLKDKPAKDINYEVLARKTAGFSGADIKSVVDQAVEGKLEEAMRTGNLVLMSQKDLEKAVKRVKPSTKEWFATARNHAVYSNESGIYDDILDYLKIKKP